MGVAIGIIGKNTPCLVARRPDGVTMRHVNSQRYFGAAGIDCVRAIRLSPAGANDARVRLAQLLCRQHLNDSAAGLTAAVASWPEDIWPKKIGLFPVDGTSESDFLHEASTGEFKSDTSECQAYYYVAMAHLVKGESEQARGYFNKCISTHIPALEESMLVRAELARVH